MKILRKDIKSALQSDRQLQSGAYQDWDNDNEARLIYAVRVECGSDWKHFDTQAGILHMLYDTLPGRYSDLPAIPHS